MHTRDIALKHIFPLSSCVCVTVCWKMGKFYCSILVLHFLRASYRHPVSPVRDKVYYQGHHVFDVFFPTHQW